jgi:hypothetical protein
LYLINRKMVCRFQSGPREIVMHNPTLLPSLLSTTQAQVPQSVLEACLVSVPVYAGRAEIVCTCAKGVTVMFKKIFCLTAALLLTAGIASTGWAALQAVDEVTAPGGFPLYYTDQNDLSLELCLEPGWCFFDPVDETDPNQVDLGIGGEVFWWMAETVAPPLVPGGRSLLVLALEGTFGGDEAVVNGNQISFGRVRIRVDVPTPGSYRILYPYGEKIFQNVTAADGINYTADIGSSDFLDPRSAFAGALNSEIQPNFLTWTTFAADPAESDPALVVFNDQGEVEAHYIGDMNIEHPVTGSAIADTDHPSNFRNYFAIQRWQNNDWVTLSHTDLFAVMGKVYGGQDFILHEFPQEEEPPVGNLAAVGPINRVGSFNPNAPVTDPPEATAGYPFGFPIWYEDQTGVEDEPGLRLTICPASDPMCIGDAIDYSDPVEVAFQTGGESFWWSADAVINANTNYERLSGTLPTGFNAGLGLALESTFGGAHEIFDGNQISFGRVRLRIDTPVAGNYIIVHPYDVLEFNVSTTGTRAINHTDDGGIINPSDPDGAFVGALYSKIGPNFLTWPDYATDARLQKPFVNDETLTVQYVGDPAIAHEVIGSTLPFDGEEEPPANYFRVIGPGFDVLTRLFNVQGKVFAEDTFRVIADINAPIARNDAAQTEQNVPVAIEVLANDTYEGAVVIVPGPAVNGSVAVNGTLVTFTPNAAFNGEASFVYTLSDVNGTSNPATVTVTVTPIETIAVTSARLDLRKLRWDIKGTSNFDGTTLTLYAGPDTTGAIIGTVQVNSGKWEFRGTATANPNVTRISIQSSTGKELLNQPLQVR